MDADAQQGLTERDIVELSTEDFLALRMEAAELGALPAPTGIARPDGRPGLTAAMAGATILPAEVATAQRRLADARETGSPEDVQAAQRHLADVAGLKLREGDQQLPVEGRGPAIAELVGIDLMNRMQVGIQRYGRPLQAFNGRSAKRDLYEELLDACCYIRQDIEEEETRAREAGVADIPAPPPIRAGSVVVTATADGGYAAWQWREREWWPLITPDDFAGLSDEEHQAIEDHAGPLPR